MVMEFDQYLQLCDVTESHYRALYDSVMRPPRVDVYHSTAVTRSTGLPTPSTEDKPASADGDPQDGDVPSPKENRCKWDCNFDNDETETILTSHTVSFVNCVSSINVLSLRRR